MSSRPDRPCTKCGGTPRYIGKTGKASSFCRTCFRTYHRLRTRKRKGLDTTDPAPLVRKDGMCPRCTERPRGRTHNSNALLPYCRPCMTTRYNERSRDRDVKVRAHAALERELRLLLKLTAALLDGQEVRPQLAKLVALLRKKGR